MGLFSLALAGCATNAAVPSGPVARPAKTAVELDGATDISAKLQPIITQAEIPGLVAIALRGNQIIAYGAVGVRKVGSSEPVELGDSFQIASCTKAMTGTLTALLIEDGKLRWDTTVGEIFGDTVKTIDPVWKNVTVLQLLNQCSGVTSNHLVLFMRSTVGSKASLAEQRRSFATKLLAHKPELPPGTKHFYSNANYILLGAMLEKITGRAWEELMQERLFASLGITTGGFGPPGAPGSIDQPRGHGLRRFAYLPIPGKGNTPQEPGSSAADYPLAYGPAGTAHMAIADWAKFASLHLRGDPANPHHEVTLLKEESFVALHRPEASAGYAAGWETGKRKWAKGSRPGDIGRVFFHQGDNGRWNSVVWIAPEIDFAMLIVCNRASMWGQCDKVAGVLLEFAPVLKNKS